MMRAALLLMALMPGRADACAVCFGLGEARVAKAITLGIYTMLGAVFSILIALTYAVVRMEKRRALAEQAAAKL